MTIQDNKALVQRLYDLLNEGDVGAVGDLVAPNYVEHNPLPGQGSGREGVLDRFSMISAGLAPRFSIEDVVAERDRVVVRWTNTGTHVAEFAGIPPTSKPFTIAGVDVYRVADGVLAEHWDVVDQLSLLVQLGVLPEFAA
jgi:steroid delta-isomerase-like uncharacterized protein